LSYYSPEGLKPSPERMLCFEAKKPSWIFALNVMTHMAVGMV